MRADEALARSRSINPLTSNTRGKMNKLAQRDGLVGCAYCRLKIPLEGLVREHVVPRSLGGANGPDNRVLSCPQCDRAKGPRTPQEWRPGHTWGNPIIDNAKIPAHANTPAQRKRRPGLARIDIRWCATCQQAVVPHQHPEGHLIIPSSDHEPEVRHMAE